MPEGGNWILDMLEHVICDYEIDGRISKGGQALSIIHHIWNNERASFTQCVAISLAQIVSV